MSSAGSVTFRSKGIVDRSTRYLGRSIYSNFLTRIWLPFSALDRCVVHQSGSRRHRLHCQVAQQRARDSRPQTTARRPSFVAAAAMTGENRPCVTLERVEIAVFVTIPIGICGGFFFLPFFLLFFCVLSSCLLIFSFFIYLFLFRATFLL